MTLDRRHFIKSTSSVALLAGVSGLTAVGQALLAPPVMAQVHEGLYDDLALPDKALGRDDAPVTIVEYASMTCPHCKDFHKDILPKLEESYIKTGKVRLIFREFPLDNLAAAAAMLARCAPNDGYFPMLDALFAQQDSWARSDDPVSVLLKIARLAGFSEESFNACLTNQKILDDILATRKQGAEKFGVNATPTFFIGGVKFSGDFSFPNLSKAIDALL